MSTLSAFPFIGEQSFATPGAFNSPLSIISANIAAINADVGAVSGVTISPPSGNTIQMPSDLSISGYLSVGKGVSIGTQAPGTPEPVALTIGVNSGISDYIYFNDTANLRSDYLIGSHAGGTADGLNIFDVSGNTMIVSFSKQSIRFYQNVVGPVFDVGGALADTLNAATFGTGADSKESRIQAAISAASAANISRVYLPASMYPYSASSISFNNQLQMVREGGDWTVYDLRAYGASGNAGHDDTASAQAAIDGSFGGNSAAAGFAGPVYVPAGAYVISRPLFVHPATRIGGAIGLVDKDFPYCLLQASSGMTQAILSIGTLDNVSIENLTFRGPGAVSGSKAITGTNNEYLTVRACCFTAFGDEAIKTNGGAGGIFEDIFAFDCVKVKTGRTDYCGTLDLTGSDLFVSNVYADAGIVSTSTATVGLGYAAGFVFRGVISTLVNVEADQGEVGFAILGRQNRFVNCRANITRGHGWMVQNYQNEFLGCLAFDASLAAAGTYDGFSIQSNGIGGKYADCIVGATNANQLRHGFCDSTNAADQTSGNHFTDNRIIGTGVATSLYSLTNAGANFYRVQHPTGVVNQGNVSVTVVPAVDADTQVFNTPLTSTQTITVSLTGAWNGKRWRVVRTAAASGAFDLVVSPTNRHLSPNQWTDLEYVWALSGYQEVGYGNGPYGDGTASAPTITFSSELSLGLYRSAASTIASSYGTLTAPAGYFTGKLAVNEVPQNEVFSVKGTDGATSDCIAHLTGATSSQGAYLHWTDTASWNNAFGSEATTGDWTWFDSRFPGAAGTLRGRLRRTLGQWLLNDGTAIAPTHGAYSSESSLGFFRSGASTVALSYGTLNLATQAVRLSMRTLAASSVTASAANTNVATNEVVFTIGGASGASLCISSGGTTYIFSSALSAKNT